MNKVTVVVTFLQGEKVTFSDKPFLEVIQETFSEKFEKLVPVKILFPKTGKILYADKTYCVRFLEGKTTTEELVSASQCDGLFRNKEDILDKDYGMTIDAGSLWMKKDKVCLLINDDEYISVFYNEDEFKEI